MTDPSSRPGFGWFLLGLGLGVALANSPRPRRRAGEGEGKGEPEPAREPPFAHPVAEEKPEPAPLDEETSA